MNITPSPLSHVGEFASIVGIKQARVKLKRVHVDIIVNPSHAYLKASPILLEQTKVWHDKNLFLDPG